MGTNKAKWKVIGRHKWVANATITESYLDGDETGLHRFTATIHGWRNFKIWIGPTHYQSMGERTKAVIAKVREIRERIEADDQAVFSEPGAW